MGIGNWKKWPIETIKKEDNRFPRQLSEIKQCPPALYYRGVWNETIFEKTISIVGSRRMTKYGQTVIDKILPDLVAAKTTIISGFMYGVDSQAHRQCMEMGGKTVAVLAGGLDYLLPPENDSLYSLILETGGLVISEYEAGFKPTLWSFPQRNRIVSGLATLGVLVVEAAIDSGSLITAQFATKQGRDLFAIPGPITSSTSAGCNLILKNGKAKMVTEASDILKSNDKPSIQINYLDDLNSTERTIVKLLGAEALSMDELCRMINKRANEIGSTLGILGIKGIVEESAGSYYLKK